MQIQQAHAEALGHAAESADAVYDDDFDENSVSVFCKSLFERERERPGGGGG